MRRSLAALSLLALCLPALARDPKSVRADYEALKKWQFASAAAPIAAPVTFSRDTATWTLTSGTVRLMQPTSDGRVTGLVFEGEGRFRMTIPDRVERAQLARFTNRDGAEIDQKFTQAVIRFSEDGIAKLFAGITPSAHAPNELAARRHEHWLVDLFIDVDAHILEATLNAGGIQLVAAMKTADFDWITYEYDSGRQEEIRVTRYTSGYPEGWIGLERAEDRDAAGRPAGAEHPQLRMSHVDIDADLTRFRIGPGVGMNEQRMINGHYVVTMTAAATADQVGAPRLYVGNRSRELKVRDESGAEIPFLRDHIGKRSVNIGNDVHDGEAVLLLATPMKKGERRKFTFEYDYDTANFAPGGAWYPHPPESFEQGHTARLAFTFNKRLELRSMGRREKETNEGEHKRAVWVVDKPAKMITFSTAERFEEVEIKVEGIPKVVVFGPDYTSWTNKQKMRNVGADVANSLQYFQNLLDDPLGGETMYVTSIASGHGQAFDGFLHMTEATFTGEHPGASELFRAHEVAHSWWGHRVGWKTYRDQWLSESLAEYSAMMFVQGFVRGGDKLFREMLMAYEGIIKGDLRGGFSKFSRPWLIEMNAAHRERIGPIDLGYRAGTREIPAAYLIQAYHKGPLVIHMLRLLLFYRTGSDDAFVKVLREFNREFRGKAPSTADFRRTLERVVPADWGFFFDAWVYGADIPRITWSYKVEPEGGAYRITLHMKRTGVADDFVTPIPVRVEYEDGTASILFVPSKQPEQTLSHKVAKKPRNVTFGPDHSLLAHIRRD